MKFIYTLLMFVPALLMAQFNGPEAVDHDPSTDLYYISNKSGGSILVGPAGGPYSTLTSSVSSPHGIEVIADTVYVCDGNSIKAFQLPGGALVNTYTISGASFLNGLTSDRDHMLWFTDFSQKRIHSLDLTTGQDQIIVTNTVSTPNGIILDEPNSRLVIVTWGSNAPILQYDLLSNALSTVVPGTGLNNCDGVALGCDGKFYVSSWGAGAIHTYNNDLSMGPTLFVNGLSQPSDIHYNIVADTVVSPNFGSSTVTFHNDPCLGTGIQEQEISSFNVWPNPGNGLLQLNGSTFGDLQIFDQQGRLVQDMEVNGSNIDLQYLANGQYVLTFTDKKSETVYRTKYLKTSNK